ncbi:TolC family protein [Massilia sp. Mn16-1_5]|uniref:TolC family protein n=1 Tax=Massilia sp. Mn16-1_5 TaxID=2079199 RepID=UPI00109EA2FA|nr:TolC family protein [Massilia sp. Mn16-1_5]THC40228.1 TolC family protein [Massilia sp. Mn16-1_5]
MHPKYLFLGAAVLFAQAFPSAAQLTAQPLVSGPTTQQQIPSTGVALTLEEAVAKALAANAGLRATALDVAIAEGARRQAGLFRNPEVSFVREGTQRGTRTQTVQLSQVLELGGKRSARINLAERERSLAVGNLSVARTDLRAEVTAAYFDALSAQERVQIAQVSLDVASKASFAAERRVAAGRVSPVEQDRSGVALSTARLELSQAQSELSIALLTLAAYWGETVAVSRPLVAPGLDLAPVPSLNELQQRLDSSPQMRRARLQVEREEAQVGVDRSQRIPDVTLIVGSKKDDQIGRSQTVLGVSVPLPLFNRNQGSLQASLSRAEKARTELEAERLRLNQSLASAYQRTQLYREQVRTMRDDVLPRAQRVFDAAVTGFEAGKFSFLDVLDAQRTLLQIRTQYIQTQFDRYRAAADLGRFVDADSTTPNNRIAP